MWKGLEGGAENRRNGREKDGEKRWRRGDRRTVPRRRRRREGRGRIGEMKLIPTFATKVTSAVIIDYFHLI